MMKTGTYGRYPWRATERKCTVELGPKVAKYGIRSRTLTETIQICKFYAHQNCWICWMFMDPAVMEA